MKTDSKYTGLEIAIVGMACTMPGARNWREFWENLVSGKESLHTLSREEMEALKMDEETIRHHDYIPVVPALKEKDAFDAAFFDYTPVEAGLMNPVHRVLHQCVWEALEDAGCYPGMVKGPIGIYVGAGDDSNWRLYSRLRNRTEGMDSFSLNNINNKDFLAALVSYKLNLKGPVVAVNTTCSTSLVTVHLACRSLLLGEAKLALAGGITLRSEIQYGYFFQEGLIFSRDGHCRTFDKEASGTVATEGAGIVVLKRLQDAIDEKDHIYAIIKGSAINNDGNRKVDFTAVSVEGQVDCITRAQKFAKVTPETITYVEAHGTGTRLGDPIEVEALNIAFNNNRDHRCAIGSVKTNIGHLDTAAGVAGLMKTALSLQYRQLPASLHFQEANPEIDFAAGPFYVNTRLQQWERHGDWPLRAGVSSFGIGGTNAHAILEEAPSLPATDVGKRYQVLTVSAKTASSVSRYLQKLQRFIESEPALNLADMSYTLQTGRREFGYRQTVVFEDREELLLLLQSGRLQEQISRSPERMPGIVLMFSGQGAQYAGMTRGLYEEERVFREAMDKGFSLLKTLTGTSFKEILFGAEGDKIQDTRYAQPLLFLVEYSLTMLLRSMGITPQYMIGHSIGEYTAACVSGLLGLEDALQLVVKRGALMSELAPGAMLSIPVTAEAASAYVNDRISLAAVNGPEQVVLSGDLEAIAALKEQLESEGISFIQLHTSHAFHSAMLDEVKASFARSFEGIVFKSIDIPFISNLTGTVATTATVANAAYWVSHMREPVQFSKGLQTLLLQGKEWLFIEVGPGHALTGLLKQQSSANRPIGINLVRPVKETIHDQRYLAEKIGQLWKQGVSIDWQGYHQGEQRRKVSLPTYCFEPVKYPTEVDPVKGFLQAGIHLQGAGDNKELKDWIYHPSWKSVIAGDPGIPGNRTYLFFSDDNTFSNTLTHQIAKEQNEIVIEVGIGETFQQVAPHKYLLQPAASEQYDLLIAALSDAGIAITDIIYAWGIGAGAHQLSLQKDNTALNRVYFGLVYLVQSLLRAHLLKEKRIAVLTEGLHKVLGTETGNHAQSLLLALVQVLPQEYSVTCCNIDLQEQAETNSQAIRLLNEVSYNKGGKERIVAFRNGQRWVQEFQKNTRKVENRTTTLKEGGVYLVTGGLGNVGFVISKYLQENYKARLILTGRSEINRLRKEAVFHYNELRSISEAVHYFPVDVSDGDALEEMVTEIMQKTGKIDGIIHTAGIIDDHYFELIEDITPAKTVAMLAPKVQGIENIYRVFRERNPDFVWVTSSLSTVLGGLGFSSYAAANLYMDHFIASRAAELPGWRSISLGDMVFTEKDIRKESGLTRACLKPDEIAALFHWSLGDTGSRVLVQTVEELSVRIHRVFEVKKEAYLNDDREVPAAPSRSERPTLSNKYVAPQTATEEKMVDLFENFFGIEGIGTEDNFFELGGDSLKAMMMLKRIKNEFDINITLTDFFQHDRAGAMASFIDHIRSIATESRKASKKIVI